MADTAIDAIRYLRTVGVALQSDLSDRIYMSIAPQNAIYPLAVMEIVSRTETPTQDSGSAIDTFRVQVDVYAQADTGRSGFEIASIISGQLRDAWSRTYDLQTYANGIESVQEVNYFTDFIPDLNVFRVSNDYMVRVSAIGTGMSQIIFRRKLSFTFASFSTAAVTNTISSGFTLPAKGVIHHIFYNPSTTFSGGALTSYTLSVGRTGDTNYWLPPMSIFTGATNGAWYADPPLASSMTATTDVKLTATASGNLNTATAGSVDIYIYYSILN